MISNAEETRCGYKVDSKVKKIWKIEIDMLQNLLQVCKNNNLRIIVYSGTLLGAVRHSGFIPWDDDLDVALPRADFDKLLQIAENEFKAPLFFQTALNDSKYFFDYARLRNSNTTGIIKWNMSHDYNNGIYIDIYPLDGYIENKAKLKIQLAKKEVLKQFLACYYADDTYVSRKSKWMVKMISRIAHIKSYEWWYKKYVDNLSKYTGKTIRLSQIHDEYSVIKKYWCLESDLDDVIYLPFENIEVPVPANYDEILTHMYGEYMEFPPEEERGKWHENKIIFDPDMPYKDFLKNNKII